MAAIKTLNRRMYYSGVVIVAMRRFLHQPAVSERDCNDAYPWQFPACNKDDTGMLGFVD
jgi:hypothetical protein